MIIQVSKQKQTMGQSGNFFFFFGFYGFAKSDLYEMAFNSKFQARYTQRICCIFYILSSVFTLLESILEPNKHLQIYMSTVFLIFLLLSPVAQFIVTMFQNNIDLPVILLLLSQFVLYSSHCIPIQCIHSKNAFSCTLQSMYSSFDLVRLKYSMVQRN